MKQIIKEPVLFCVGGMAYNVIEVLYRGYTHWTMFVVGGLCFILIGLINEILSWETALWKQMMIGGTVITVVEFVTGCVVNLWLGWNIWDYSQLPLNILGQICMPFYFVWVLLSLVGIVLDDTIRWKCFGEDKPRYKIF